MESLFLFCDGRVARIYHYLFSIEVVSELVHVMKIFSLKNNETIVILGYLHLCWFTFELNYLIYRTDMARVIINVLFNIYLIFGYVIYVTENNSNWPLLLQLLL